MSEFFYRPIGQDVGFDPRVQQCLRRTGHGGPGKAGLAASGLGGSAAHDLADALAGLDLSCTPSPKDQRDPRWDRHSSDPSEPQRVRHASQRREAAQIEGQMGELEASIAEARSSIAGFVFERLRIEAEFREKAQDELRSLQPKEAELREKLRVIDTQRSRLVLRAPMAGAVLGLQAHTVGGVIPAGAEVASIVPSATTLVLFADIDPRQIDRVHEGQTAKVRFPNFDARTTPEVDASVISVSADAISEPNTNRHFYRAELALTPEARITLGQRELVPGMPVEAFIQTDARSPASFLLKPLADYWAYAMREE